MHPDILLFPLPPPLSNSTSTMSQNPKSEVPKKKSLSTMSNKPKTSKASTSKSAKPKSTTDQGSSSKSDPKVIVEVSEMPVTKHKDTPKFKTTSVNRQKEPASASAKGKGKEKLEDKKIAQKWHFEDQGSSPATKCKFMNTFFNKDP
ncbi:MAG TPA: hypothetical protein VN457_04220 [Chlamydiales bacterium]|nr:hypothetical protein [Chlamydiales bacterium]